MLFTQLSTTTNTKYICMSFQSNYIKNSIQEKAISNKPTKPTKKTFKKNGNRQNYTNYNVCSKCAKRYYLLFYSMAIRGFYHTNCDSL